MHGRFMPGEGVSRRELRIGENVRRPNDSGHGASELPLLHRAAIAYLVLPFGIWLVGWHRWWVGVPLGLLLVAGLRKALSGGLGALKTPPRVLAAVLLVALAWVAATPALGLFLAPDDWIAHRGVFLELTRGEWPTYLAGYAWDDPPLLRYYLGWFMVPALAGRWLGPSALDWAVPLWTWCGVSLALLLLVRGLPTARAALVATAVFVLFSGMDVAEYVLHDGVPETAELLANKADRTWTEAPRGLEFVRSAHSPMMLEYQSNHKTLLVTPQHFIPGAVAALLILQAGGRKRFLAVVGVVLAACVFWSSLLSTGLLPLAAAAALRKSRARVVLTWQNAFLAVVLTGVLATYLTSGKVDYPANWLWSLYDSKLRMSADLLFLYWSEFLLLVLLLWRLDPKVVREPVFLAATGALLVMPWYCYGTPRFNEWGIRFAVPSLVVVSCFAARAVAGRMHKKTMERRSRVAFGALLAVLGLGAVTVVYDAGPVLANPQRQLSYGRMQAHLSTDANAMALAQRSAHAVPDLLGALLREPDAPSLPGRLLIRSEYDVYLENERLVHVKRNCSPDAPGDFFLEAHPRDVAALPAHLREIGYETLHHRMEPWKHYKRGACVVPSRSLDYDVARIKTGQLLPDKKRLWESEARIGPPR